MKSLKNHKKPRRELHNDLSDAYNLDADIKFQKCRQISRDETCRKLAAQGREVVNCQSFSYPESLIYRSPTQNNLIQIHLTLPNMAHIPNKQKTSLATPYDMTLAEQRRASLRFCLEQIEKEPLDAVRYDADDRLSS